MKKIRPMYFVFAALLVQFVTIYVVWISVDQNNSSRLMAGNVSSVVLIVFAIIMSIIKMIYNKRKKIKNRVGLNIIFWFFSLIYIGILVAGFKFLELYPGI
ncbi:hypothetical protein [Clostridium grantii]|uniref:Uncharacterized protein n=1 Tax=Clostridium grantii DSM 8605 TaxID=1121316 RepID=A0A1M5RKF1_9CLOT|nr:hypothetical protein [Clostridium grantii]SHH26548.1 hypothetical protein SAMN02745207_00574 [Clostridium grantii DSM 8605]